MEMLSGKEDQFQARSSGSSISGCMPLGLATATVEECFLEKGLHHDFLLLFLANGEEYGGGGAPYGAERFNPGVREGSTGVLVKAVYCGGGLDWDDLTG